MAGKPRRRGEREQEGSTKAAILLFLAERGEQSFTEIRLYIRAKSNIRSPKNLRLHLAGLSEAGLLRRSSSRPGKADTYELLKSYQGIRALFSFFQARGREKEIMATPHFCSYIGSEDFQQKVILGIIRTCILQAGEKTESARWQKWLAEQTGHLPGGISRLIWEWAEEVREGDQLSIFRRNFTDLLARYRTEDIDAIHGMFFQLLAAYRQIDPQYKSGEYMIMVNEFILPARFRERLFSMVQISPAACDYILNRMADNPLFPSPKLMGQVLEFLALFPEIYDFTIPEGGTTRYIDALDKGLRSQFIERVFNFSGEPSTYMMVKALFIHDLVYGNLACDRVPEQISRLIVE